MALWSGFTCTVMLLCLCFTVSTFARSNNRRTRPSYSLDRHNVLLPEKVKLVLGLPDLSPSKSPKGYREGASKYAPEKPPRFMRELYQVYRHGSAHAEMTTGNTVRSIHADIGDVNGGHMFVFNLSSIGRQEKILSAEIHIFRKKTKASKRRKDPEMLVYEVAPQYMTLTKQISLHQSSRGWHSVQVTQSVRSCLAVRRQQPHLLALTFEAENNNGRASLMSLKKFVSRHSLPFLIVFSNDTVNNITLDHLDPHYGKSSNVRKPSVPKGPPSIVPLSHPSFFHGTDFTLEELGLATGGKTPKPLVNSNPIETDIKPQANETETITDNRTDQKQSADTATPRPNENTDDVNKNITVERRKRSMMDNKIPEEPFDFSTLNYNVPHTHPSILISRKESRQKGSNSKLIPYPESSKKGRRGKHHRNRKRNRKNRRRRKKQSKKILPFPTEWEEDENTGTILKDDNLCGRRRLVVNFADIGWGEWIISPTSFDAHYCAGSCPFPLTKNLRPSNHATIQSIINVIGIRPDVPAPCCVPETMSSVTLLYFDENKNVVLKNYPHMSVESCSCR